MPDEVKTYEMRIATAAHHDIMAIADYIIATGSPQIAADIADGLYSHCDTLATLPERQRARDNANQIHVTGFKRWQIFYRVEDTTVIVLRVIDGARDISADDVR